MESVVWGCRRWGLGKAECGVRSQERKEEGGGGDGEDRDWG